jgi:hypothetical protein
MFVKATSREQPLLNTPPYRYSAGDASLQDTRQKEPVRKN